MKVGYSSPRITWEVFECSMPVTFDQYSACGFNCKYCFSQYQKLLGDSEKGYLTKSIKGVDVKKIKDVFLGKRKDWYSEYIKEKIPLQWGGLADPFCPFEEKYGIGLELLQFFADIKYPISFSSKSDLVLRDKRYLDCFKKAGEIWHYKSSIITYDEEKAKLVEGGVPSPKRRLKVLKTLSDLGVKTTFRLRPFIIGLSEKTLDEMIREAKSAGCQSVSTEFFCIELRSLKKQKTIDNFRDINEALGFDIVKLYRSFKEGRAGYLRGQYEFKKKYAKKIIDTCKKYDIPVIFSDNDFKQFACSESCCGILNKKIIKSHFSESSISSLVL